MCILVVLQPVNGDVEFVGIVTCKSAVDHVSIMGILYDREGSAVCGGKLFRVGLCIPFDKIPRLILETDSLCEKPVDFRNVLATHVLPSGIGS